MDNIKGVPKTNVGFTADVYGYVIYPDGTKKLIEEGHNTVVNNFALLIACLVKGEAGYGGVTYMALGSGSGSWDNNNPPAPAKTDSLLTLETYRKAITSDNIVYLDDSGKVSASPTKNIKISVTFLEGEGNGDVREFAIFGGNATSTLNSGIMIDHKTQAYFCKTSKVQYQKIIIIKFAVA
jgi:hypothetical protein